jgi:hypothetical protein
MGRTEKAQFLGYEISPFQRNDARERTYYKRRVLNGKGELSLPAAVIQEKCRRYMAHNKPIHRKAMLNDSVFAIMRHFQGGYRGIDEYYHVAHNVYGRNKLKWIMAQAVVKTLAAKRKLSVRKVYSDSMRHFLSMGTLTRGFRWSFNEKGSNR